MYPFNIPEERRKLKQTKQLIYFVQVESSHTLYISSSLGQLDLKTLSIQNSLHQVN